MADIVLNADRVDVSILPPLLQDLAALIGIEAALTICDRWGGTRLFVPKTISADHIIAQVAGLTSAQRLGAIYGGDELAVPRGAKALRHVRNQAIIKRYRAGDSAAAIARDYRMTERWVYALVGRGRVDDRQFRLF